MENELKEESLKRPVAVAVIPATWANIAVVLGYARWL